MTWLDIITPISKTLIPDDERRQDVNRGILITVTLLLAFLFFCIKRSLNVAASTEQDDGVDFPRESKTWGTKKGPSNRSFFWCPERESNPHDIAITGF